MPDGSHPIHWYPYSSIVIAGITLRGASIGDQGFVEAFLDKKVEKIAELTGLLPHLHLQGPHTEFSLLDPASPFPSQCSLTRILGIPIPDLQWDQAKIPVALGGLGLQGALAPGSRSCCLSYQPLVRQHCHISIWMVKTRCEWSKQIKDKSSPNSVRRQDQKTYFDFETR